MNTTDLSQQIENLVRSHLAQVHTEAAAAMERAFASVRASTKKPEPARRTRTEGLRRDPAMVAELGERLYAEVMASPGEQMTVYAKRLDASAHKLHRPMTALKLAGRLRTTGARNNTRYFPMPGS